MKNNTERYSIRSDKEWKYSEGLDRGHKQHYTYRFISIYIQSEIQVYISRLKKESQYLRTYELSSWYKYIIRIWYVHDLTWKGIKNLFQKQQFCISLKISKKKLYRYLGLFGRLEFALALLTVSIGFPARVEACPLLNLTYFRMNHFADFLEIFFGFSSLRLYFFWDDCTVKNSKY